MSENKEKNVFESESLAEQRSVDRSKECDQSFSEAATRMEERRKRLNDDVSRDHKKDFLTILGSTGLVLGTEIGGTVLESHLEKKGKLTPEQMMYVKFGCRAVGLVGAAVTIMNMVKIIDKLSHRESIEALEDEILELRNHVHHTGKLDTYFLQAAVQVEVNNAMNKHFIGLIDMMKEHGIKVDEKKVKELKEKSSHQLKTPAVYDTEIKDKIEKDLKASNPGELAGDEE